MSKITNSVRNLIDLCDKFELGDPFGGGRAREIVLAAALGQNLGEDLTKCDAFIYDEDGYREEFEYKTSLESTFKYNLSQKATWEETYEYLYEKIVGNKYHYFAIFSRRMEIQKVYYMDGETAFRLLLPKLQKRFFQDKTNLKDRRFYAMMSLGDIKEYGKVLNQDLLIKKQDSPLEPVIDAIRSLVDVFDFFRLGDPFGGGRTREAILAEFLNHTIGDDLSGADAYSADGCEYEYKTGFGFNGRYEVSTYPNWEEQEEYLVNEKIGYYDIHYYAVFNRKYELVKVYKMSGKKANDILLPKFRDFYFRDKTNLASHTLTASMTRRDAVKYGELIFDLTR